MQESPRQVFDIVHMFQTRRNKLRDQQAEQKDIKTKRWSGNSTLKLRPWEDEVNEDYLASPDFLGDIMWDTWCTSSTPCTLDENCVISLLSLLNVVGSTGESSCPDNSGRVKLPKAEDCDGSAKDRVKVIRKMNRNPDAKKANVPAKKPDTPGKNPQAKKPTTKTETVTVNLVKAQQGVVAD